MRELVCWHSLCWRIKSKQSYKNAVSIELTDPKYSGTRFFRNIGNYLPLDMANTPEDLNIPSVSTLQRTAV